MKCFFGPSRRSPHTMAPTKALSMKNANMPSMARVWPITPPAIFENSDQLVPNWNSMGMPVTTPTAKLIPKIRLQNRAAWACALASVRSAFHLHHTRKGARPMVSCGNR